MSTSELPMPVARIFVSHSHYDDAVGKRLVTDLQARLGRDAVWYDAAGGLHPGDEWWNTILDELWARNIFLVILSPEAVASAWVQREMALAYNQHVQQNKILLPLTYRPCEIPKGWELVQFLPVSDPAVDPAAYEDQLATLFGAIEHALATMPSYIVKPAVVSPPPPRVHEGAHSGDSLPADSAVDPKWERWEYVGGLTSSRVLNWVIQSASLLLCGLLLIPYWLLIGYTTPAIFPYPILRISKSAFLMNWLRGNGGKTQLIKALIVFASLTVDWFVAGVILTRVVPVSLLSPLPLGPANTLGLAGVVVFFILLFVYLGLWIREWPYLNVTNFRKILQVSAVTTLLFFASQIPYFGLAFLYFPILAMVVSILLFLYNIIGLGGSSYGDWGAGYNAKLERLRQNQLRDNALAKAYFERRATRQATRKIRR